MERLSNAEMALIDRDFQAAYLLETLVLRTIEFSPVDDLVHPELDFIASDVYPDILSSTTKMLTFKEICAVCFGIQIDFVDRGAVTVLRVYL